MRIIARTGGIDLTSNLALGGSLRPTSRVKLVNPSTGTLVAGVVVDKIRQLTLDEVMERRTKVGGVQYPGGSLEILVNNTK